MYVYVLQCIHSERTKKAMLLETDPITCIILRHFAFDAVFELRPDKEKPMAFVLLSKQF